MEKRCIYGCPLNDSTMLHGIPDDSERKAEWFRILGVEPMETKQIYVCSKHFSEGNMDGSEPFRFAKPDCNLQPYNGIESQSESHGSSDSSKRNCTQIMENSPDSMNKRAVNTSTEQRDIEIVNYTENEMGNFAVEPLSSPDNASTRIENTENIPQPEQKINSILDESDIHFTEEDVVEEEVIAQNDIAEEAKVEDFEMCSDTSKDTILKGRYVQLKDYLIVSYTTPTKLKLKQQVKRLNKKCDKQAERIKLRKSENLRLSKEVVKYKKLAGKLKKDLNKNPKKKVRIEQ